MTDPSQEPGSQPSTGGFFVAPTNEALAEVLPGYEILGLLGQGGMGAVYKARQINLDRIVAIKVLPNDPENDTMNFAERFQREARAMAKFLHSRIIAVFDFGKTQIEQAHPSGVTATVDLLYIVIEFVEGTDLSKILSEELLPPSQVVNIFTQICDALSFAHSHDIVHRDIKPANIMLDVTGNVKVADFGLAKLTGESAAAQAQLTISGTAMGTPDYVAPEVLEMGTEPDHRVDIYALGVMLYQMLTGRIPRGLFRSPTELIPGLDPRLEEVIEKAMQADPDHRYQTVEEFWTDLDEIRTTPQPVDPDLEQATVAMQQQPSSRVKIKPPEGSTQDVKVGAATHVEEKKRTFPLKLLLIGVGALIAVGLSAFLVFGLKEETTSAHKSPVVVIPPLPGERQDLLAAINPERDITGSATWQWSPDGLTAMSGGFGMATSPVPVSGSYEFQFDIFRKGELRDRRQHFSVSFPVGGRPLLFIPTISHIDLFPESFGGLEIIDGHTLLNENNPTLFSPSPVKTGDSERFIVRVQEKSNDHWNVEVFHEEVLLTSWSGDPAVLKPAVRWKVNGDNRIAFGLNETHGDAGFLSATLAPLDSLSAPALKPGEPIDLLTNLDLDHDVNEGGATRTAEPIDLLATLDLERDSKEGGEWEMTPEGLSHIGGRNAVAIPPVPIPGSYELEVRMFPRGGHLAITFPVGDSEATLLPNLSQPNPFVAIEMIRSMGGRHEDNPTHSADSPVKNGVETSLLLRVTEQPPGDWTIEVFHKGTLLTSWTGPPSDLNSQKVWRLPESHRIGLGSFESKGGATYLSAILTPLPDSSGK